MTMHHASARFVPDRPHRLRAVSLIITAALLAVGCGGGESLGDADAVVESGRPTASSVAASDDVYVADGGCYRFTPVSDWVVTETNQVTTSFSSGDAVIEASCSPLFQVGGDGPIELPALELVEDQEVPFGGGDGRRIEYLAEFPGTPVEVWLSVSVDRKDARCSLNINGPEGAVELSRDDFEKAVASFSCDGI